VVNSSGGGLAVTNVGLARMVYYFDSDGAIRELNNSMQWPNEVWMEDETPSVDGGNTGVMADPSAAVGPSGSPVATGIPNGKVSMAPGFRGTMQQLWLFYQTNGTDVSVQIRNADATGNWTDPTPIPVSL
jgi:hypothetical protein